MFELLKVYIQFLSLALEWSIHKLRIVCRSDILCRSQGYLMVVNFHNSYFYRRIARNTLHSIHITRITQWLNTAHLYSEKRKIELAIFLPYKGKKLLSKHTSGKPNAFIRLAIVRSWPEYIQNFRSGISGPRVRFRKRSNISRIK